MITPTLLIAHDMSSGFEYEQEVISFFRDLKSMPTLYAVATKEFGAPPPRAAAFVGWGNGLFIDDGGLVTSTTSKGTLVDGLFLGGRVAFHPPNTTLTVWPRTTPGTGTRRHCDWRGITLGLYGTELEKGRAIRRSAALPRLQLRKWNVSLGYRAI